MGLAGTVAFALTQEGVAALAILERDARRTTGISTTGKREVWSNDRIFFVSEVRVPMHRTQAAAEAVQAFLERVNERRAAMDLATAWEVTSDARSSLTFSDLAGLLFGREGPEERAAVAAALALDDTYFRVVGEETCKPLPREAVVAARRAREREEQEKGQIERAAAALSRGLDLSDEACRNGVAWLKELAVFGTESKDGMRGAALLALLRGGTPGDQKLDAFDTLVSLGVFDEDEVLAIHEHKIRREFPKEVLEEAKRLAAQGLDEDRRQLEPAPGWPGPFSIDDPWTTEVDDALMVEPALEAVRVHVLIADPSSLVTLDSAVGKEGALRAATLYLPNGKVPMLPPVLSEHALSLLQGEARPMLDFVSTLAQDGRVLDFSVVPVVARVERRLSYDEADQLLGLPDDPTGRALSTLHALACGLRARRIEAGAQIIERDEVSVRVENGEVVVRRLRSDSPSRQTVSEFMVLACTQVGAFGRTHGIPLVYRRQSPPDDRNATEGLVKGTRAFAYRMLRSLRRAELTAQPDYHFGLGVIGYAQVTSPLRRFQDLVAHVQVKGFLRLGRPPLDSDAILRFFGDLENRAEAIAQVERQARRYFLLKYLKRFENKEVLGEVVARVSSRAVVHLEETGLEVQVPGLAHLEPGTRVMLRVRKVDPRRDILILA